MTLVPTVPLDGNDSFILVFFQELVITRYFACAGCAIIWWDWLVTLDDEITHIWPTRWSTTKFIFLANRYLNIVIQPIVVVHMAGLKASHSHKICRIYAITYACFVFFSLASIHALVVVRAWVIWGRRRWVTATLVSLYAIYTLTCLPMIIVAFIGGGGDDIVDFNGSCITFPSPSLSYMWITSLVLEYASFGLVCANIWLHRQETDLAFQELTPLRRKIYRAALLFVIYTTVIHICNIVIWARFASRPFNLLAVTFAYCLTNVAGQRFVLDLRQLNVERKPVSQVSVLRFSKIVLPLILSPAHGTPGTWLTLPDVEV